MLLRLDFRQVCERQYPRVSVTLLLFRSQRPEPRPLPEKRGAPASASSDAARGVGAWVCALLLGPAVFQEFNRLQRFCQGALGAHAHPLTPRKSFYLGHVICQMLAGDLHVQRLTIAVPYLSGFSSCGLLAPEWTRTRTGEAQSWQGGVLQRLSGYPASALQVDEDGPVQAHGCWSSGLRSKL